MSIAWGFEPANLPTFSEYISATVRRICQWTGSITSSISATLTPPSFMPNRFGGGLLARAYFATVARDIPILRAPPLARIPAAWPCAPPSRRHLTPGWLPAGIWLTISPRTLGILPAGRCGRQSLKFPHLLKYPGLCNLNPLTNRSISVPTAGAPFAARNAPARGGAGCEGMISPW